MPPDPRDLRNRTTREVMASHLHHRRTGDLEADLTENYHPEVVVLSAREVFRGHDGVRASAHRLWRAAAEGTYSYGYVLADDRMAMLEWSGRNEQFDIRCGIDSYLVEDGWITAQTIHYRVEDAGLSVSGALLVPGDQVGVHAKDDPARLPGLADGA